MNRNFIYETGATLAGLVAGLLVYQLVFYFLKRWSHKKKSILPGLLSAYIYYPGLTLVVELMAMVGFSVLGDRLKEQYSTVIRHGLVVLIIATTGFLITRIILVLSKLALHHYASEDPLNYAPRRAKTKFQLIQRVLNSVIIFTAFAIILMTFDSIRQVGSTLLASAGVVGIIIGFAAQKSLGTFFAGIQIAISQPIRIDDTVVVEGTFGTIGEITLTYVVLNSWDGRRLIVPINYFLEKNFENWTRTSPEVIAKVLIYADYTMPVAELREQFMKWVEASPLWDKRSKGFLVTDATERTIELRATMSARNAGDAYDLECQIREQLITYIREKHAYALPKVRTMELTSSTDPG
jgi:small-conductance mechanosensitive channel